MAGPADVSPNGTLYAADINQLVNILALLYSSAAPTNGNTAGTVKLWQPFQSDDFKLVALFFSGFRNAGANQDLLLPKAFANGAMFYIGNVVNPTTATSSGLQFLSSGTAQSVNEYNGQNAAPATGTNCKAMNIGAVQTGFDTIRILGTANWTGTATDWVFVVGS